MPEAFLRACPEPAWWQSQAGGKWAKGGAWLYGKREGERKSECWVLLTSLCSGYKLGGAGGGVAIYILLPISKCDFYLNFSFHLMTKQQLWNTQCISQLRAFPPEVDSKCHSISAREDSIRCHISLWEAHDSMGPCSMSTQISLCPCLHHVVPPDCLAVSWQPLGPPEKLCVSALTHQMTFLPLLFTHRVSECLPGLRWTWHHRCPFFFSPQMGSFLTSLHSKTHPGPFLSLVSSLTASLET